MQGSAYFYSALHFSYQTLWRDGGVKFLPLRGEWGLFVQLGEGRKCETRAELWSASWFALRLNHIRYFSVFTSSLCLPHSFQITMSLERIKESLFKWPMDHAQSTADATQNEQWYSLFTPPVEYINIMSFSKDKQ